MPIADIRPRQRHHTAPLTRAAMRRFVAKRPETYFVDEGVRRCLRKRDREWRLYELASWAREREAEDDAREARRWLISQGVG